MISKDRLETVRETDTHYFFWKSAFSQWSMRDFKRDGIVYNCCEQYMMAEKARLFKDDDALNKIMSSSSPKTQKRQGRLVKNYDDKTWQSISRYTVFIGNMAKFSQHADLKEKLLSTGKKIIVEASPYDALWGVALGPWDDKILDEKNWQGENWLGQELMAVRGLLRDLE
jgi:hypothetical protein